MAHNGGIPVPSPGRDTKYPSLMDDTDLIVDDIPPLSRKDMKRLNPVVTSSKDQVACAYEKCGKKIYPPKKLCDGCMTVLSKACADKMLRDRRENGDDSR